MTPISDAALLDHLMVRLLAYRQTVDLASHPPCSAEMSPANTILFRHCYGWHLSKVGGEDVVMGRRLDGTPHVLCLPDVAYSADRVERLRRSNNVFPVPIETLDEELIMNPGHVIDFQQDRNDSDYIYESSSLRDFTGGGHRETRKLLNRLERSAVVRTRPATDGDATIVDQWADQRRATRGDRDSTECRRALQLRLLLNLSCTAYLVDDHLAGLSIVDATLPNTSVVLFAKALYSVPGLTAYMYRDVAAKNPQNRYINLCQDIGIPGLRARKTRFRPIRLLHKYMLMASDATPGKLAKY